MSQVILLDSAPVGLITNPKAMPLAVQCQQWFLSFSQRGYQVILPEIIDYEIRRELLKANKLSGIRKLEELKSEIIYWLNSMNFYTVILKKSTDYWVSLCLENGIVGQGNTPEK
ncbi:MAG: hypothetical protein ACRC78_06775, partial [Planktothrix sp.]